MRESPCVGKRMEGVDIHYSYRQQGEATNFARLTQMVECLLYMQNVGSSILPSRTNSVSDESEGTKR